MLDQESKSRYCCPYLSWASSELPLNSACCNLQSGYPGHTQDFCKGSNEGIFNTRKQCFCLEHSRSWKYWPAGCALIFFIFYFWPHWVFEVVHGLLAAVHRLSLVVCAGFSWLLLLRRHGCKACGLQ